MGILMGNTVSWKIPWEILMGNIEISPYFPLYGSVIPDYVRGVIFRLVDVHLLIRANVMLYFPTTFACRCDLIKVPPATQYNVHV